MLADAIKRNRTKHGRWKRAETTLRKIRLRIFDYEDESQAKYEKARRVMATCQRILAPKWAAERAAYEDRMLQETPSKFEPGLNHNRSSRGARR